MPKVKDLGVTVVPEQFGPAEIGPGGGCYQTQYCTDCTMQQFSICGTSPAPRAAAVGAGCTDCTVQQFSICGTSPGPRPGGGCTDCTIVPFSICGTTPGPVFCTDCTYRAFSICGTSPVACRFNSINPWTPCGGTWETTCGGSWGDPWGRGGLTHEGIAQMRQQLQSQLVQLDEAEKALGPKTAEEIDAREKQLNAELDRLKSARAGLKKTK